MTLRCAIVDDEPWCLARLGRLLQREPGVEVSGAFADPRVAVRRVAAAPPDLLFLDVQMPELDGFQLLAALPVLPAVIFVTAYDAYAIRAFEAHAVDYLLKPVSTPRFRDALAHARGRLSTRGSPEPTLRGLLAERLAVQSPEGTVLLSLDEIDWVESADNYAEVHAGPRSFLLREPLQVLEQRLAPARFVRIHRRTLVNLAQVRELHPLLAGDWSVSLRSGRRLRLSRTYRQRVLAALGLTGAPG